MATNIPPHNLNEVVDACLHLLRNPEASIDELMEIVPAPDFPTAGIIYGMSGVKDGYRTGRGRVVMRAKCHFEDIDKGQRQAIIVDEIALPGQQEDAARAHGRAGAREEDRRHQPHPGRVRQDGMRWSSSSSAAKCPRWC
jgi:hypothetical protein